MSGGLIPLCRELVEDLATGSMRGSCPNVQVSGDYTAWRSQIEHWFRRGVVKPLDEAQLGMWPIQCECTGIQSFGLSAVLSRLVCPLCAAPYYSLARRVAILGAYLGNHPMVDSSRRARRDRLEAVLDALSVVDDLYAAPVSREAEDALEVMLAIGVTTITGSHGRDAADRFGGLVGQRRYVRRPL